MTAPVLSPNEHDEAVRFGIHDLDILAEMEEHADDVLPCLDEDCESAATHLVALRCCGLQYFVCDEHLKTGIEETRNYLLSLIIQLASPRCTRCRHKFPYLSLFEDIYRVVPL